MAEGQSHDDVDTCRICSVPSEEDRPLFYPCKCSGTIKYIHQDCLTTWLEHSKKKTCDVCKHPYAFTNVYAQDMPQRLPAHLVAKRVLGQLLSAVVMSLRAMLVSLIWLALVPYLTVITWRTYFWFGDVIAWWLNARPKPEPVAPPLGTLSWLGNLTTFILDADADPADLHVSRETAHAIARSISTDIFTGQIIASMIVLIFLCVFLLREWIMQNARPGLFEEQPAPEDIPALAPADAVAPLPAPAPAPAGIPLPEVVVERPPTPPPVRPATPIPRALPPSLGEPAARPGPVFVGAPGTPAENRAPRRRSPSPSPSSTIASSVYPVSESDSDNADDENDAPLTSPAREFAAVSPKRSAADSSSSRVEFSPSKSRKGKTGSFDASRQAFHALRAKKRADSPRSSSTSTLASSSSGVSVGGFEWPPLQDAPMTPLSAMSPQGVPFTPLRSASQSSSVAPHSAATTTSPVVDHEPAQMQIPPFTPSAFQFVVDPGPSTPSTMAESPEQDRRPDMTLRIGELSAFSADYPRSGTGSSPAFELPSMSPFTPSALNSAGDERLQSPFGRQWGSSTSSLLLPGDASTSEAGSSSATSDNAALIPPFTPSLFTFQGSASERPAAGRSPVATDTPAGQDSEFTFTFAQDVPGSSSFRVAAARRPGLAPATPSEEIPIALYRAPEDLDALDEDRRKRRRSFSNAEREMDHYFRRAEPADAPAQNGPEDGDEDEDGELIPALEEMTETETEFEDQFEDLDDDDENEDDWEDMDEPVGEGDAQGQGRAPAGGVQADGQPAADVAPPPADVNGDEDLDGALEAVGMRGPIGIIFQNAAIAAVLLDLAIALGIWLPYTMGKTLGLLTLNPRRALTLLNMPLRAVRFVTDPAVDFCMSLITRFIVPTALFVPRMLRVFVVATWFVVTRLYIQATDSLSRAVSGDPSAVPTLREREMAFRARDMTLIKLLRLDLGAVTGHLGNVTTRWFSMLQPSAMDVAPKRSTNGSDWATNLLHRLPVDHVKAEEYVHSLKTLSEHGARRWVSLVEGDGTPERLLAVSLGYFLVLLAAASYLNTFTSANARTAGRAARNVVRQQLVVLKVAMFIVIELLMFPVGCGVLLDLCTLRMLPEATIQSRITFFKHSPFTALFSHWLLGTTFMYQFAIMLSACRTIMRPGAMWFVKDPGDPTAHPIRDIIDRPATTQLKKLGVSVVMYAIVIAVGFGCMVAILLAFCSDLFPLRWNLREPLSEVPVDLLFAHLVLPATLKYMRFKSTARAFLEQWWKFMCHQLRLTSYMYSGRHPSEEYTPNHWTWRNPFNVGDSQAPEGVALDGGFRRVPATDSVALPKDKKVVVRTDAAGNPLTVEGAAVIAAQVAEAEENKRDPKADYAVVYVPPRFGLRVLALMFCLWLTTVVVVLFAFSFPLRVGRAIIALCTDRILHDVYAFTIGAYALAGGWLIGTELPIAQKPWTLVRGFLLWAPQAAYLALALGVVLPTLLALFLELYVTLPLRMWLFPTTEPVIRLAHCWATGLIMGRIALWTNRLPRADRNNEQDAERGVMHAWHAIERNGLLAPDVFTATREFIVPVGGCLTTAIVIPALVFVAAQKFIPVPIPAKLLPQAVYVSIFAIACVSSVIGAVAEHASSWAQGVRDQEFLVERRLRNLEARK